MRRAAAAVFSVLCPGAGQAFNGEWRRAAVFAAIYVLAPVPLLLLTTAAAREVAVEVLAGVKALTHLWSVGDAAWKGGKGKADWRAALVVIAAAFTTRFVLSWGLERLVVFLVNREV